MAVPRTGSQSREEEKILAVCAKIAALNGRILDGETILECDEELCEAVGRWPGKLPDRLASRVIPAVCALHDIFPKWALRKLQEQYMQGYDRLRQGLARQPCEEGWRVDYCGCRRLCVPAVHVTSAKFRRAYRPLTSERVRRNNLPAAAAKQREKERRERLAEQAEQDAASDFEGWGDTF